MKKYIKKTIKKVADIDMELSKKSVKKTQPEFIEGELVNTELAKKGPLVLTEDNYYTAENTCLSHSKIKNFRKEPWYFYQKNILCSIPDGNSDILLLGRMVDVYITEGVEAFDSTYAVVARRTPSRVTEDGREQVTASLHAEALGLAKSISSQDAFLEMEGFESQRILQVNKKVGEHFTGLCGKPDWIKIDLERGECTIRDLKTTRSIDTREFYYSALNYGYFSQACYYAMLTKMMYPTVKKFKFEILAVEKTAETGYRVQTFTLNADRVKEEQPMLKQAIKDISETKKWEPRNVSFSDAIELK